jgi:membrane protease subunit HflC
MRTLVAFVLIVVLAWIGFGLFTFTVDETKKAVVLQFGEIVRVVEEPGLYFKTPFVQNVVYLEDRLLTYDIQPAPVITVDKKRLEMDSYTIWRIRDAQRFMEALQGNRANAEQRLDDIIYSLLRDVVGKLDFQQVLQREFLNEVLQRAQRQVDEFGIEVVDVRIKRADLPTAIKQDVFQRMISERKQRAQQIRAEGEREAQRIRAEADKRIQILLAEAQKRAEELKGEGDGEALRIYAEAYNRDPNFFLFWRTLESYKKSLAQNSTLVLSTDSDYLKLLDIMESKRLIEALGGGRK